MNLIRRLYAAITRNSIVLLREREGGKRVERIAFWSGNRLFAWYRRPSRMVMLEDGGECASRHVDRWEYVVRRK